MQIYKIQLNTCEHYIRCSDCLASGDPNGCGWCGGVCRSRRECGDWDEEASGDGEGSDGVATEADVDTDDDDDVEWVTDQCSPVIYEVSYRVYHDSRILKLYHGPV